MGRGVAHKLIGLHLIEGELIPGGDFELRIDQTLTQDAIVLAGGVINDFRRRATPA